LHELIPLASHVQPRTYEKGALLGEEDDLSHELLFIVSGSVAVFKDIEIVSESRAPGHHPQPTFIETRRCRRIQVATRSKGECVGDEAASGCARLDFTYKATSRVEALVLPRSAFLPLFQPVRLAEMKARVSATRSQAVNLLNILVVDYLPNSMRERLGMSLTQAAYAHANARNRDEHGFPIQPAHKLTVNMLESIPDDLLGRNEDAPHHLLEQQLLQHHQQQAEPALRGRSRYAKSPIRPRTRTSPSRSLHATPNNQQRSLQPSPSAPALLSNGSKTNLPPILSPDRTQQLTAASITPDKRAQTASTTVSPSSTSSIIDPSGASVNVNVNGATLGLKLSQGAALSRVVTRNRVETAPPHVHVYFGTFAI